MTSWLQTIADQVALCGAAVRVSIMRADGSAPREAGASMIVTERGTAGTIGGGALELDALSKARSLLSNATLEARAPWFRDTRDYPLGPNLGQCCGGYVKVLFELFTPAEAAALIYQVTPHPAASRPPSPARGEGSYLAARSTSAFETVRCRTVPSPLAGEGQGEGALTAACLAVRPIKPGAPIRVIHHRKDGYAELPLQVIRITRDMLSAARPTGAVFVPASKRGPAWFIEPADRNKTPLFLYGAGHVGRAIVSLLGNLPFQVTWIDTSESRFPAKQVESSELTVCLAKDPPALAKTAPSGAFHLVMTYSHPLDLAVCHEVLKSGTFGYLGLIGSATKRARFVKRLRELGHNDSDLDRLTCPIGIPSVIGKEPAMIAISVAAQLLEQAASASRSLDKPRHSGVAP
jgi:xanthine dehydrogenase accessory factor